MTADDGTSIASPPQDNRHRLRNSLILLNVALWLLILLAIGEYFL
jgi:hypothetical protein